MTTAVIPLSVRQLWRTRRAHVRQRTCWGAPARAWTTDELLAFAFDDRSHSPINFQPGEQYQYSNTNTLVLGKMIERLTGEKFEDLLRQEILLPLDLHSTVYLGGIKMPRPAVQGYQG